MLRKAGFVLLVLLLSDPAAAEQWASKIFETTRHDFGSVPQYAKAEFPFVFTNIWMDDVHVASAQASCGCTSVTIINPLLKTYQKGEIVAKLNTDRFLGARSATVTVVFDRPSPATVQLQVSGTIRSDVVLEPSSVVFGDVDHGTAVARTITVTRNGRPDWTIRDIESANPHLSGQVLGVQSDGAWVRVSLEIRLDAKAPVGYIRDQLILVTNDPRCPSVPVQVDGRVTAALTVSPESLFLGVLRPGQSTTKQVVIRAKEPFRVMSVTTDGARVTLDAALPATARPLQVVPVTFTAGSDPGKVEQKIRFQSDIEGVASELTILAVVESQEGAG